MRLEIPETRVPTILVGSGTMLYLLYPGWSFPSVWMSGSCRVQSDSCVPLWFAADLCELKSTFFRLKHKQVSELFLVASIALTAMISHGIGVHSCLWAIFDRYCADISILLLLQSNFSCAAPPRWFLMCQLGSLLVTCLLGCEHLKTTAASGHCEDKS